jgi:hypothetical protein
MSASRNAAGRTVIDAFDAAHKPAFTVTIDGRISDEQAAAAKLLDASPPRADVVDRSHPVGARPTADIRAYWFGRTTGEWHAASAAEHARSRTAAELAAGVSPRAYAHAYVTLYERPGVQVSSAQPGLPARPLGEVQVSSEPVDEPHARGLIDAFNGQNGDMTYPAWPRSTVTLANGEEATLVADQFDGTGPTRAGFYVITSSTLISVIGDVAADDIPTLAARLRPIA